MDLSAIIPATVIAAIVSGVVAYLVALINRTTALEVRGEQTVAEQGVLKKKIDADITLAIKRIDAEIAASISERAWADYELRRDAYIKLAHLVDCLFSGNEQASNIESHKIARSEFHRIARQVRLVGSDDVVSALNAMTLEIKSGGAKANQKYSALFNAMRVDIRKIHSLPPEGTNLGEESFPIEF